MAPFQVWTVSFPDGTVRIACVVVFWNTPNVWGHLTNQQDVKLIKFIHIYIYTPLKHSSLQQSKIIFINQAPYTPHKNWPSIIMYHPCRIHPKSYSTKKTLTATNQLGMLTVKRVGVFQDHQPTTILRHQPTTNIGTFLSFFPTKRATAGVSSLWFQDLEDRPIFRDFDRSASRMSRFSTKSRTLTTGSTTRDGAIGSTAVPVEVTDMGGPGKSASLWPCWDGENVARTQGLGCWWPPTI